MSPIRRFFSPWIINKLSSTTRRRSHSLPNLPTVAKTSSLEPHVHQNTHAPVYEKFKVSTITPYSIDTLNKIKNLKPNINFLPTVNKKDASNDAVSQTLIVNPLEGVLERPAKIQDALNKHQFVVVGGSGFTGKTEQVRLAIPNPEILDIKTAYLQDVFGEMPIPNNAWKHYDRYKKGEKEWLTNNLDRLIEKFGNSNAKTIVIDEADYYGMNSTLLVQLIKGLKDREKNVVIVLHPSGLNDTEFFSELEREGICKNKNEQLIETGWFTEEEEEKMLQFAGYNPPESKIIMDRTKGNPVAYVGILKAAANQSKESQMPFIPVNEFLRRAKINTKKMIEISLKEKDYPTAIRLINSPILHEGVDNRNLFTSIMFNHLKDTHLINLFHKMLLKSGFNLTKNNGRLLENLAANHPYCHQLVECFKTASELNLEISVKVDGNNIYLIPNKVEMAKLQKEVFSTISSTIPPLPYHSDWWLYHSNSATSAEELQKDAKQILPSLFKIGKNISNVCPDVYPDAGPNNMFAIKGKPRMEEKILAYMEQGLSRAEAAGQITDPVRMSLVIKKNSKTTIAEIAPILNTILAEDPSVSFYTFMNKFENDNPEQNPTGYGALHLVLMIKDPNDPSRSTYAELQIHHETPLEVKNGLMHTLYEATRSKKASNKTDALASQQLVSIIAHKKAMQPEEYKNENI